MQNNLKIYQGTEYIHFMMSDIHNVLILRGVIRSMSDNSTMPTI